MSNAIRTYARKSTGGTTRRHRGGLGCFVPFILLIGIVAAWVGWVTRDAYPSNRFIAADRSYEIYAGNFLKKRERLSEAALWRLLPESTPLASDFAVLSEKLDMPDWVLNHIAYSTFHVSGHDLEEFSDPLLISRMSRIGCLIERFNRLSEGVGYDAAGGLKLRSVDNGALFYAVRGRILLVSPNRDALIRALTLTPAQCAPVSEGPEAPLPQLAPDVHVRIQPAEGSSLAEIFERAEIGFSATGTNAEFDCRISLTPAHAERFSPLLAEATPVPLLQPTPGLLVVSGNFGRNLPATWHGIESALTDFTWFNTFMEDCRAFAGDRQSALNEAFAPLLVNAGPGWSMTWHGIDTNAMLPIPQLTLYAENQAQVFQAHMAELPLLPESGYDWDTVAYRMPDEDLLFSPLRGGQAMTPTAAQTGDLLLIGLGENTVRQAMANTKKLFLDTPANLRVAFEPKVVLDPLRNTALKLASEGLLRDASTESVREAWKPWIDLSSEIANVEMRAAHEDDALHITLSMKLTESSAKE